MGNVTIGKYDFNDEAFDNVSAECIDFITKLLMKEHDKRLTAKEALRHKWVKKRPQYTPSSTAKASSSPLSFKPVYSEKVRKSSSKLAMPSAARSLATCTCFHRWWSEHCKSTSARSSSLTEAKLSFPLSVISLTIHLIVFFDEFFLLHFVFFSRRFRTPRWRRPKIIYGIAWIDGMKARPMFLTNTQNQYRPFTPASHRR